MGNRIDVLGIGNAIMDVITPVPDVFLGPNDITKGGMTLIDEATALGLHPLAWTLEPVLQKQKAALPRRGV